MPYKIQKLSVSGVIDQAAAIVKDNFLLFLKIVAMTWVPVQIVIFVAGQLILPPQITETSTQEEIIAFFQAFAVLMGIIIVLLMFFLPLTNASVIHAVAELYLGRTVTAKEAVMASFGKIAPLIGTGILMGLATFGGMILCIVPGILFALWFVLGQHVVVLEETSGTAALSRSKELVQPHMGNLIAIGLMVWVIQAMVNGAANLIPQVYLQGVAAITLGAVTTVFSAAVFVVFYFSCRCANENFDLEHLAAAVDEGAAPPVEEDGEELFDEN